jgi:hypothetical protein
MPTQPYRELGAIQVAEGDLSDHNTLVMIDQSACAMGADAIVVSPAQTNSCGGALEAIAIAYASNLATRAAQASAATEGGGASRESPGPVAQLSQQLPPATTDESAASAPVRHKPVRRPRR